MNIVKYFEQINANELALVGGKGLSLGRMSQAGLPVPHGFVVTVQAYEESKDNGITEELARSIYAAFDQLHVRRVAVRSSAVSEDASDASWAGQFESYLNIDRENLLESIKKCWQSASSDVVAAYAESKATKEGYRLIAVVVQAMVESEVSGVAFSVNPVNKQSDEIMVEAIYGLGELLVQGMITPDNYVISKITNEIISKTVKTKPNRLVYDGNSNIEESVPKNIQSLSCLTDAQILELGTLVKRIEEFYRTPQDIEWAFENNRFYIVQSRPITTL